MTGMMRANPLISIQAFGQSVWMDFLSRDLLKSGEFFQMVLAGEVCGVTTNPAIFDKAISSDHIYDEQMLALRNRGYAPSDIARELMKTDVIETANELQSTYRRTNGTDGLVSMEVSPHLAHDPDATLRDARLLWHAIDRPNLLIKVPVTRVCLPAIRALLFEGINVNATLLFDGTRYLDVAEAYLKALEDRAAAGLSLDSVISVASFFVSRIDSMLDPLLSLQRDAQPLTGKAAVASAQLVYEQYTRIFSGARFRELERRGARRQRLVWASTSTKNPAYPDTLYIEPLIGRETITTMPVETLNAYRDHGAPEETLPGDTNAARQILERIASMGIDMREVCIKLEEEGVRKFCTAYDNLVQTVTARCIRPIQVSGSTAHHDGESRLHSSGS